MVKSPTISPNCKKTLDSLTNYYLGRLNSLPPQLGKIVAILCSMRHPVAYSSIKTKGCFKSDNICTGQIQKLKNMRYLKAIGKIGGRAHYELCEPLMGLCIRSRTHGLNKSLLDFLILWYGKEDLPGLKEWLAMQGYDPAPSYRYLEELLKGQQDPMVSNYLRQLDNCLRHNHQIKRALNVAEQLVNIRDQASDYYIKGFCLYKLGRYEESLALFHEVLCRDRENARAWRDKGYVEFALQNYSQAQVSLEKATFLDIKDARSWYYLGDVYFAQQQYDKAQIAYKNSLQFEEKAIVYARQGWAWIKQDDYQKAMACFKSAVAREENCLSAWLGQGIIFLCHGDYQDAIAAFTRVVSLDSENVSAWIGKGHALFASGQFNEAFATFDQIIADCDKEAFAVILQELLHHLFLSNYRSTPWRPVAGQLLVFCRQHDILLPLLTAIIGSAYWPNPQITTMADWVDLWWEYGEQDQAMRFAANFLQGIADYLAGKPRYAMIVPTLIAWRHCQLMANEYLAMLKGRQPTALARLLPNFVADLFAGEQWQEIAAELVGYYRDNGIVDILGLNVMNSIGNIRNLPPTDPRIDRWARLWQDHAGKTKELQIAVAYLEVAVEFHTTGDDSVFGKLCAADREILLAYFPGLAAEIQHKFADSS